MAKDQTLGKRNHKKSSKAKRPATPPPNTHATRSSASVAKKSSPTPHSRSRVASAASSRNTFKAPKRTVVIEDPAVEDTEESYSASHDVVMEDSPEPTALEKKAAMLRRELVATKKIAEIEAALKAARVTDSRSRHPTPLTSKLSTAMPEGHMSLPAAEQVVDSSEDSGFSSLARDFPMDTHRMLADIPHRKFDVKKILRLSAEFAAADSKDAPEMRTITHLIRPFEVFCQTLCALAPERDQQPLQLAMSLYQVRPMELTAVDSHASILNYHNKLVARLIRIGLDDPALWRQPYQNAEWKLQPLHARQQPQRRTTATHATDTWIPEYSQASTRTPRPLPAKDPDLPWGPENGGCIRFNQAAGCTVGGCSFQHVCFKYQSPAHGMTACPKRTTRR